MKKTLLYKIRGILSIIFLALIGMSLLVYPISFSGSSIESLIGSLAIVLFMVYHLIVYPIKLIYKDLKE